MTAEQIHRYEETERVNTNLDPLTDLVTWLDYYSAVNYVASLLTTRHGVATGAAKTRARLIRPHARLAREYIDQALSGPNDVAFLPTYYAILNLLKIYILFGPHYAQLPRNRWHGATYDGYAKHSQTLLTETITVKKQGTIPLFYQTITGCPIQRDSPLKLAEIYPYLWDVATEFRMASGHPSKIAYLTSKMRTVGSEKRLQVRLLVEQGLVLPKSRELKALIGFQKTTDPHLLVSKPIAGTPPQIRCHLRPYLLYQHVGSGLAGCRISASHFVFPEEFPITLAFFHLSSVVRYKPEFLDRLRDSKYWAVISAARRHCLLKFLITFWSFTHKKTLIIHH
jgi:hypothetical protein